MYLVFSNNGCIEELTFKSFGISAKEHENAIGRFGTGLKYAIAIILRTGGEITIHSGNTKYEFGKKIISFRNKEFEYITCNGETLAYTTELGKDWELWMAYRELYSNCLDERGEISTSENSKHTISNTTRIIVNHEDILNIHLYDTEKVFLKTEPILKSPNCNIHQGKSKYVYNNGIRVYTLERESVYTYNIIGKIQLSEDRTIKYNYSMNDIIAKNIIQNSCKRFIDTIFKNQESFEFHLDYTYCKEAFNPVFIEHCIKNYKNDPNCIPNTLQNSLISARKDFSDFEPTELDTLEHEKLKKAKIFCKQIGFDPYPYETIVVETLGPEVLGLAFRTDRKIVLSKRLFDMGLKQIISTLVEEVVHIREGLSDCTLNMQTYLFDKIVTMGEKNTGIML